MYRFRDAPLWRSRFGEAIVFSGPWNSAEKAGNVLQQELAMNAKVRLRKEREAGRNGEAA